MSRTTNHVEASQRPRRPWPRRLWSAFVRTWRKPHETTIGQIVTAGAVLALAGWFIIAGFQAVKDRELNRAIDSQLESDYTTAIATHDREVAAYSLCLTAAEQRVDTRDTIRRVLFDYADGIANLLPDEPLAQQFAADRHKFVDANYGPYDLATEQAKCQAPGGEPIDPSPEGS